MTDMDLECTKERWMKPRAHRLLTEGWSPSQADDQAEQWWLESTEGRLVAEVERLRARVAQLEDPPHPLPAAGSRTYLCCPCCDDLPEDHPGGIRDHHTIYCATPGCTTGATLAPASPPVDTDATATGPNIIDRTKD
ncbi:MAG: hypothetical protein DI630_00750 [Gordonia sp. (in: high G+C Gram-positive bacteria)]|nr:MAG: hypothetical protein DI630_00750 [Gordonia sp. (in: high G+C Gram-positive bacteria)]